MTVKVEFHFDFGSPNAYFCHRLIPAIEARTGVSFDYVPILLGGVFKLTNNQSPMAQFADVKNKNEYQRLETQRFIRKHGLNAYVRNPNFPVNTIQLMRAAVALRQSEKFLDFIEAIFQQMWEQGQKMDDPEIFDAQLAAAGFDVAAITAQIQDPAVKQALMDLTAGSVARGCFGAPSFFVNDEMSFGKDRLADVEEEIMAQKTR
jgi:2-hydroxychromene-2-carboxylate isomerase